MSSTNKMDNWRSSLFDCYSDCFSCWVTGNISACLQGESVQIAIGGGCAGPAILAQLLCCIGGAMNRSKIRERFNIPGSCIEDCLCMWCCGLCATCQMYREAKSRCYMVGQPGVQAVVVQPGQMAPGYPK